MRFSLSLPLLRDLSSPDPFRETFELARIAEASGFDTATIGHHHFMPGNMADPLTFLAAVAARTDVLRVGTGIFQLPIHNPVRVAEQDERRRQRGQQGGERGRRARHAGRRDDRPGPDVHGGDGDQRRGGVGYPGRRDDRHPSRGGR